MASLVKVIISVFLVWLVVTVIIFFTIFGMLPAERLSKVLRGDFEKATSTPTLIIISTTTIIERIIISTSTARELPYIQQPQEPVEPLRVTPPANFDVVKLTLEDGTFRPSILHTAVGREIRITLTSLDGTYHLRIPAYGLSQTVRLGEQKLIAFQATTQGQFAITCDECEDFEGALVVE